MPGNRAIFDRALEDNRIAGERGAWPEALRAAIRAAQEFPDDPDARIAVAVGFYHTQKYTEAAQLLEDLRKRRGSDPFTLSYLARAYEGAQIADKAVEVLAELGEQSIREGRPADAQEAFEEAVRLSPAVRRAHACAAGRVFRRKRSAQASSGAVCRDRAHALCCR